VKEQLEKLVLQMYKSGIQYSDAVRQFQRAFIVTVLREQKVNQVRSARILGVHRNTLRRMLREFDVNIHLLRAGRRPPRSERYGLAQKKARAT
jgi:Fis family transcriptional regulator